MKSEAIKNPDEGVLVRLHDTLADRYAPVTEYPNLKVAIRSADQMKMHPSSQYGDYQLIYIGDRIGNELVSKNPEVVWIYEPKDALTNVAP